MRTLLTHKMAVLTTLAAVLAGVAAVAWWGWNRAPARWADHAPAETRAWPAGRDETPSPAAIAEDTRSVAPDPGAKPLLAAAAKETHSKAPGQPQAPTPDRRSNSASTLPPHPLLGQKPAAIWADIGEVTSTATPALREVIRTLAAAVAGVEASQGPGQPGPSPAPPAPSQPGPTPPLARLVIDYPLDQSIFPPEIVPPTVLWHDSHPQADTWLVRLAFAGSNETIEVLVPGHPPPAGPIDPRCMTKTNEIYRGTPYQASARAWQVDDRVWAAFKQRSVERPATLTLVGFNSAQPQQPLSWGRMTLVTSKDPVGAPIFYRDVPLAPSATEEGVIKPLSEAFLPLIAWRLRDISRPESRLLLTDLLTCANCHSFTADGKTLAMDLDGPAGDKGTYAIAPVARETVIDQEHVITWNSFAGKPPGQKTIGFLSSISPDGRFVVTTLNESVYVQNFTDYRFLQVFYPTRGILGYYDRASGQIRPLSGADDPQYVHCDPAWTPDGKWIIFARAPAKDPYPPGYRPAQYPNDPAEVPIQYDLYRISFNEGRGGTAKPIAGASGNGTSNTFPKVSPDGKWIVFVRCRNGQLLRPDSELWIVPVQGGTARRMRCNTPRMNSWHSFSPNGRWMVFSSKWNTPYTEMFLTHLDDEGNDSPAVLIPNATAANRAVNLPEFVNVPYEQFASIRVPAAQYLRDGMRGIELFEQGRLDEALAQFEEAVRKQPDYLEGQVSIAVILIEKGRLDEAIARLEKALALDPKCWFAHANLGLVRQRQGRRAEAIAHFRKAVEQNPKHLIARTNLGRALAEEGQLDEAIEQFRAAVALAPQDAPSRVNLGNALLDRGLLSEAVHQYRKALELDGGSAAARLGLAETLARQNDFAAALAEFRQAYHAHPNDPAVLHGLAWLLATCPEPRLRDPTEALRLAQRACAATANRDFASLRSLAAAHARLGHWPEAIAAAEAALKLAESQHPAAAAELRQLLNRYRAHKP